MIFAPWLNKVHADTAHSMTSCTGGKSPDRMPFGRRITHSSTFCCSEKMARLPVHGLPPSSRTIAVPLRGITSASTLRPHSERRSRFGKESGGRLSRTGKSAESLVFFTPTTARTLPRSTWNQVAIDLKMRLVFSTPGKPQGRGKDRAFFRTVNESFLCESHRLHTARTPQTYVVARPIRRAVFALS